MLTGCATSNRTQNPPLYLQEGTRGQVNGLRKQKVKTGTGRTRHRPNKAQAEQKGGYAHVISKTSSRETVAGAGKAGTQPGPAAGNRSDLQAGPAAYRI